MFKEPGMNFKKAINELLKSKDNIKKHWRGDWLVKVPVDMAIAPNMVKFHTL